MITKTEKKMEKTEKKFDENGWKWRLRSFFGGAALEYKYKEFGAYRVCVGAREGVPAGVAVCNVPENFGFVLGMEYRMAVMLAKFIDDETLAPYFEAALGTVFVTATSVKDYPCMGEILDAHTSMLDRLNTSMQTELKKEDDDKILEDEAAKEYAKQNASRTYAAGMDALMGMRKDAAELDKLLSKGEDGQGGEG